MNSLGETGMTICLLESERVEVVSLQDNYIDIAAHDGNEIVRRAHRERNMGKSILAEHGFSAVVNLTRGRCARSMLFDFGFSERGALTNAESLGVDLSTVEAMVLSLIHI